MSTEEKKENNKSDERKAQLEEIKEMGSVAAFDGKHKIYCLTIIGEIEGHNVLPEQNKTTKYEHVIPQLVAIEESREIEGLLVVLNTVGGDVEAGLAIAELISGMKKPTVSYVLGGGHSIGVPQVMNHFARMQARITDFVVRNSSITAERFTELMMNTGEMVTDVGSVLSGEKAVKEGLIDEIGSLGTVLDGLYKLIENK